MQLPRCNTRNDKQRRVWAANHFMVDLNPEARELERIEGDPRLAAGVQDAEC